MRTSFTFAVHYTVFWRFIIDAAGKQTFSAPQRPDEAECILLLAKHLELARTGYEPEAAAVRVWHLANASGFDNKLLQSPALGVYSLTGLSNGSCRPDEQKRRRRRGQTLCTIAVEHWPTSILDTAARLG